jgi:hypothetical protein
MKWKKLLQELKKPRHFVLPTKHELQHYEHYTHITYMGLVGLESHYWYGKVAIIGFAIAIGSMFIRDGAHQVVEQIAQEL